MRTSRPVLDQLFSPALVLGACFWVPVWGNDSPLALALAAACFAAPILWLAASLARSLRG